MTVTDDISQYFLPRSKARKSPHYKTRTVNLYRSQDLIKLSAFPNKVISFTARLRCHFLMSNGKLLYGPCRSKIFGDHLCECIHWIHPAYFSWNVECVCWSWTILVISCIFLVRLVFFIKLLRLDIGCLSLIMLTLIWRFYRLCYLKSIFAISD